MAIRAALAVIMLTASVATAPPVLGSVATAPPVLDQDSFARWRDTIRPTREETRWQEIPWRTTFWDGVTEAQKKDRPLLVWVMNGHPLACT